MTLPDRLWALVISRRAEGGLLLVGWFAGRQEDALRHLKALLDLAKRDLGGIPAFLETDVVGAGIASFGTDVVDGRVYVVDPNVDSSDFHRQDGEDDSSAHRTSAWPWAEKAVSSSAISLSPNSLPLATCAVPPSFW